MSPTPMRFNGTLKQWNAERGFGFIVAEQGGQQVFVHISAFGRDARVPTVGEALSFEIARDADGRKRAARVLRPGDNAMADTTAAGSTSRSSRTHRRAPPVSQGDASVVTRVLVVLVALGVGWFAYAHWSDQRAALLAAPPAEAQMPAQAVAGQTPPLAVLPAATAFRCDGRLHCGQMTSCAEAKQFLKHCPGTQMDGDNDGVPCEQQWCTGLFGN